MLKCIWSLHIYLPTYLSIYRSIDLSIYLSIDLSIHPSIGQGDALYQIHLDAYAHTRGRIWQQRQIQLESLGFLA